MRKKKNYWKASSARCYLKANLTLKGGRGRVECSCVCSFPFSYVRKYAVGGQMHKCARRFRLAQSQSNIHGGDIMLSLNLESSFTYSLSLSQLWIYLETGKITQSAHASATWLIICLCRSRWNQRMNFRCLVRCVWPLWRCSLFLADTFALLIVTLRSRLKDSAKAKREKKTELWNAVHLALGIALNWP